MPLHIETQPFQFNSTVIGLSSAIFNSISAASITGGNSSQWNSAYNIATAYQTTSGSFATNTALTNYFPLSGGTITGGLTGTTVKANTFYGVNGSTCTNSGYVGYGGNAGCLFLKGGDGFANSGGDTNIGGNSGYINLSGGPASIYSTGGCGGSIIMVGAHTEGNGNFPNAGSINTSACYNTYSTYSYCGGSINTSADIYGNGGYINTSSQGNDGGSINTSGGNGGNGGNISTCNNGGYINTTGNAYGGGYINTSAGSSGDGGYIDTGGNGDNPGGYITTRAGGYINTSDNGSGNAGGYINTSSDAGGNGNGGFINTSGNAYTGGNINTSNGGGSINTTGSGYIQFGYNNQRTTLSGTATTNRTILLPNNSGTVALLSDTTNYLPLSGGTITGATKINSNLTVTGNISAQGTAYFANTLFSTTSALCAIANSSGPALYIGQSGSGDLASFYDYTPVSGPPIEVLHVGATIGNPFVGVYTSFPNKELTVVGDVSATKNFYDSVGNSSQWNTAYTSTTSLNISSSNWNNVYSLVNTTTATTFKVNNLNVTGFVNAVSANLGTTALTATLNSAPLSITSAANGSVYNAIQNTVAGVSASTDISLYNNDGINYLDLGIASTKYNGNLYSPAFNVVNAGDSYVYSTSANLVLGAASTTSNLTFFTGGTLSANERMRITPSGNVGIGTTNPNATLTVNGTVSATQIYSNFNGGQTTTVGFGTTAVNGFNFKGAFGTSTGVLFTVPAGRIFYPESISYIIDTKAGGTGIGDTMTVMRVYWTDGTTQVSNQYAPPVLTGQISTGDYFRGSLVISAASKSYVPSGTGIIAKIDAAYINGATPTTTLSGRVFITGILI